MKKLKEASTEEKIKEAARRVFTEKGYSGTRTRDIAQEAGINLALLNYYFRSKQKLFEEIMLEKVIKLFGGLSTVFYNSDSSLEEKLDEVAELYIDMLLKNPLLPTFVLSELAKGHFVIEIPIKDIISSSVFAQQLKVRSPHMEPIQFIFSLLGLLVFPFIGKPAFKQFGLTDEKGFSELMRVRRKLIPVWAKAILDA
ncbi:MAG TPA: TetR family transcriptional regulator [Saprospiraceae bacterium]|nr:TetR family transcriptional regulator [Saprospiraceae bacterium]HQW56003.1 TetR family transcriptional regulator [Saprospiraceae bacterium]